MTTQFLTLAVAAYAPLRAWGIHFDGAHADLVMVYRSIQNHGVYVMERYGRLASSFTVRYPSGPNPLEVAKREAVAIIGPSGLGKSTPLRGMNLLESPEAGTIVIGERTLECRRYTRKEAHALRQQRRWPSRTTTCSRIKPRGRMSLSACRSEKMPGAQSGRRARLAGADQSGTAGQAVCGEAIRRSAVFPTIRRRSASCGS